MAKQPDSGYPFTLADAPFMRAMRPRLQFFLLPDIGLTDFLSRCIRANFQIVVKAVATWHDHL